MAKSLSLSFVLTSLDFSEASRSAVSHVPEAPPAGAQMIQIKAHADDGMAKTSWQTIYTDTKKTCAGKVLTWNARVETAEACKQACESWGQVYVNQNSNLRCGAGYFFHKADGSPFCRLFETCDKCKATAVAGTTFTASEPCRTKCTGSVCPRADGFKKKPGLQQIQCAGPVCTTDECCDPLHPTTEEPSVEPTDPPLPDGCTSGIPVLTQCVPGRNWQSSCPNGTACHSSGCPWCPPGHHFCSLDRPHYSGVPFCRNSQTCTAQGCRDGVDPDLHMKEQCSCPVVSPPKCKAPLLQCQGVQYRNQQKSCNRGSVCDGLGCPRCPSGHHYCRKDGPHYFNIATCRNDQKCDWTGCVPGVEDNLMEEYELCDCPQH